MIFGDFLQQYRTFRLILVHFSLFFGFLEKSISADFPRKNCQKCPI
jgi:hypothetical protein